MSKFDSSTQRIVGSGVSLTCGFAGLGGSDRSGASSRYRPAAWFQVGNAGYGSFALLASVICQVGVIRFSASLWDASFFTVRFDSLRNHSTRDWLPLVAIRACKFICIASLTFDVLFLLHALFDLKFRRSQCKFPIKDYHHHPTQ